MLRTEAPEGRSAGYREEGFWRAELLSDDVRRHVARAPEALALVDGDRRLSWAALLL